MKEKIINEVQRQMLPHLNNEQLLQLKQVLEGVLFNVDVSDKQGRSIYQPFYSVNADYYAQEVYKSSGPVPLMGRGRFMHATAARVNSLIGIDLLAEL